MKYWKRKALALCLCTVSLNLYAQQAQLVSALINGCGTDGLSEYLVLYSGSTTITNVAAGDIDIRYGATSAASATGITDNFTSNASYVADLNTLVSGISLTFEAVNFGVTDIPAGSHIIVFNDGVSTVIDFSNSVFNGSGTVYVLFSSDTDWSDAGTFDNDPQGDRFFRSVINGNTTDFDYTNLSQANWATPTDGDYVQWNDGGGSAILYNNYSSCDPIDLNVLPVSLLSFMAHPMTEHIAINWSTASEINNSHFTLYRSADGIQWKEEAIIAGKNTSSATTQYRYMDHQPLSGRSYYKLKQTDFNGLYETFEIISVYFDPQHIELRIFPNPTSDYVTINCSDAVTSITLIDSRGIHFEIDHQSQTQMNMRFDIRHIPKGVYRVLIHGEKSLFKTRLIKTN